MQAEMIDHLGYEKNANANKKTTNSRNGSYQKRIKGEFGNLDVTVPRDRDATFEPVILPKGQSRFTGFDDKIIALYARGMTKLWEKTERLRKLKNLRYLALVRWQIGYVEVVE